MNQEAPGEPAETAVQQAATRHFAAGMQFRRNGTYASKRLLRWKNDRSTH